MTQTEPEFVAINVRCIPRTLRRQFKVWCTERDKLMSQVVVALIHDALEDPAGLPEEYLGPYLAEHNTALNVRHVPRELRDRLRKVCPHNCVERVVVSLIRNVMREN